MVEDVVDFNDPIVQKQQDFYEQEARLRDTPSVDIVKFVLGQLPDSKYRSAQYTVAVLNPAYDRLVQFRFPSGDMEYIITNNHFVVNPKSKEIVDWCLENAPEPMKKEPINELLSSMLSSYYRFH